MRKHEIENWVLQIVDQVKVGQPNEDSRVELKTEYPEPKTAAWQIGGHANAAKGDSILWLIGIDQKGQRVVGANNIELSNWYSSFKSKFDDSIAPVLITNLNIPVEGKTVVALLFETDRAPFVVKNSDGGQITHAVPFSKATGTHCAQRSDLIRLLSPIQKLPEVEVLLCKLDIEPTEGVKRTGEVTHCSPWKLQMSLELYVVPNGSNKAVFPFHRCKCWIKFPDAISSLELELNPYRTTSMGIDWATDPEYSSIKVTRSEVIVTDPGKFTLFASGSISEKYPNSKDVDFNISLGVIGADSPVLIRTSTSCQGFSEGTFFQKRMKRRESLPQTDELES